MRLRLEMLFTLKLLRKSRIVKFYGMFSRHFLGPEVSITWSILTADQAERSQNLIEQRELAAQAHEAQIKTEAVQHPSVMGALEILKGSVVDVKALEEFQEEE